MKSALLIHGLGRTPVSMFPPAAAVRRAGVRPLFFGYSAAVEPMPRILRRLKQTLLDRRPDYLVAHSLGGVLLRLALAELPPQPIRHFVMLGVPNQPPRLARYFWRWLPFRLWSGTSGRFLATAVDYARLPPVPCPATVIAGTAGPRGRFSPFGDELNDGVVSVGETKLDAAHETELVLAWHTRIMAHPAVLSRIAAIMTTPPSPAGDPE